MQLSPLPLVGVRHWGSRRDQLERQQRKAVDEARLRIERLKELGK